MAFNGSGSWTLPAGQPVVTGTVISSTTHNTLVSDIQTSFGTCVLKDGQQTITANLPMATFKFTGLGAGSARTDSASMVNVQDGGALLVASVAGTNTITGSLTPTITAYATGQAFRFIPAATNTGATTINLNSVGAKNIFSNGAALVGGELVVNRPAEIVYDGTQFNLINPSIAQLPINSQSAAYTTVLADGGKIILHPAADTNARTFTIDSNANVAYPLGTTLTFINQTANVVTIAITSDTLTLAGTTSTGSRSLAQNGIATAIKLASTSWLINGTGIT